MVEWTLCWLHRQHELTRRSAAAISGTAQSHLLVTSKFQAVTANPLTTIGPNNNIDFKRNVLDGWLIRPGEGQW